MPCSGVISGMSVGLGPCRRESKKVFCACLLGQGSSPKIVHLMSKQMLRVLVSPSLAWHSAQELRRAGGVYEQSQQHLDRRAQPVLSLQGLWARPSAAPTSWLLWAVLSSQQQGDSCAAGPC